MICTCSSFSRTASLRRKDRRFKPAALFFFNFFVGLIFFSSFECVLESFNLGRAVRKRVRAYSDSEGPHQPEHLTLQSIAKFLIRLYISGLSCSKLTMSLVNVSLNFDH